MATNAIPIPQGALVDDAPQQIQPQQQSQQTQQSQSVPIPQGASVDDSASLLSRVGQVGSDLLQGVGEGALQTVAGTGNLIRKGANAISPGLGEKVIPSVGQASLQSIATPDNTTQQVGKSAEDIAEFVSGDEALKGLALGEKLLKVSTVAEAYENASAFVKAAINHAMTATRVGAVTGAETTAKTGDVEKGLEAGAVGAVATPIAEGAGALAGKAGKLIADKAGELASGVKGMFTDIPKEAEGKLVDAIGDASENAGFDRGNSETLKDAVSDLSSNFKDRAQGVYQGLDDEAPGFQELRDKIANMKSAYKAQLNLDPAKADAIAGDLKEAQATMDDLLDGGQKARWSQADQDWSRYKALQQVQGKANRAATDLTSDELQDVDSLHSGVRSLSNATRKGNPIDVLAKAFGEDAGNIRSIVQDASDLKSNTQAAKLFLKWAAIGSPVAYGVVKGGTALTNALSGSH